VDMGVVDAQPILFLGDEETNWMFGKKCTVEVRRAQCGLDSKLNLNEISIHIYTLSMH